ncbi:MAG: L-glutamate gamma-semialdehyde dehydrogenase [Desulfobulbaceae bacterium]
MNEPSRTENREERIAHIGRKYWRMMEGEVPGLFDRGHWQGQLLDLVMTDESFKNDALRFVDVLPALHTPESVAVHVRDYLLRGGRNLPLPVRTALSMAGSGFAPGLAAASIRTGVRRLARRFICGKDAAEALKALNRLHRDNLAFTADILGEATTSDQEADAFLNRYRELITLLGERASQWPANPLLTDTPAGSQPLANVSVKVSALEPHIDPVDLRGSIGRIRERLLPLLRHARNHDVFVNFDLEQWELHDITYGLFEELALHRDLVDWPHLGLVVQAYLKSSGTDLDRLLDLSRRRGTPFTVRLVKGAYWDYEVAHARQHGYPCPVFTRKGLTDASYEQLADRLIDGYPLLFPALAGHNLRSLVHGLVVAEEKGLEKHALELQMLYGMAEPLRKVFVREGYRVRVYAPIGDLLPGMAYLVRRLLENTSNTGFLRQGYHDAAPIEEMLKPPVLEPEDVWKTPLAPGDLASPFANAPLLDFREGSVREGFGLAVAQAPGSFPLRVPVIINGKELFCGAEKIHPSPNDPAMEVTVSARAGEQEVEEALQTAFTAFPAWRDRPPAERAALVERLGTLLEEQRMELAALQTHEVGKPWREADADVAEAIDFCRYYARRALPELEPERLGDLPGEHNLLLYEGRGPTAVIAPWNFPLAILCGMTTAALAAGNPVLVKPATAAAGTGYCFFRLLLEAGFPPEVIHFLPGSGEEVGARLVRDSRVAQIAFTGSRDVGLSIIEQAGLTHPGQGEVKRVVCEMGGKNAIIVDEDADPDAALKGVITSAFGYAGQKCSACSRLILVGETAELFLERLVNACRSLRLAPATDPACRLGPVIDGQALRRLLEIVDNPPDGARLLFRGEAPGTGLFVPPTLFEVDDPGHPLMQRELFGPVLTIIRAPDFEAALSIAADSEYALTGSVYSRSPSNLEKARRSFKVGNLYINRHCTGAVVGRQPFGGFGMSGIGTKAGGPGYLRLFAHPRCISENTMRSGFIPELQT